MSQVQNLISRHRRKLIVAGIVLGGSIVVVKYTQRKLLKYQERKAKELFERSRRMQHYESLEQTCNQVILGMGAELTHSLSVHCSMEDLLEKLRHNPPNKVDLWEDLKILAFTKITTLVYASSMLVVALRIKINVLGGYLYRDIITEKNNMNDELKEKYMSLIRYFVQDNGLKDLVNTIKSKTAELVGPIPLSKKLTLSELEQLFWSIQLSLNSDTENGPNARMSKYLFPSEMPENTDAFQTMCYETLDLLESEDAMNISANNVSRGFCLATDAIAELFGESIKTAEENKINISNKMNETFQDNAQSSSYNFNINNAEIAMAKVIPILNHITSNEVDTNSFPYNLPTSLLSSFTIAEKNKILGANVYETFSSTT